MVLRVNGSVGVPASDATLLADLIALLWPPPATDAPPLAQLAVVSRGAPDAAGWVPIELRVLAAPTASAPRPDDVVDVLQEYVQEVADAAATGNPPSGFVPGTDPPWLRDLQVSGITCDGTSSVRLANGQCYPLSTASTDNTMLYIVIAVATFMTFLVLIVCRRQRALAKRLKAAVQPKQQQQQQQQHAERYLYRPSSSAGGKRKSGRKSARRSKSKGKHKGKSRRKSARRK